MAKGRHRAARHPLDILQDAQREWRWFVNWWRYFRRYRRNRTHHWLLDPLHRISHLIRTRKG